MKILILATDIYTQGGIARYTASLASALGEILEPVNVDVLALLNIGEHFAPENFRIIDAQSPRPTFDAKLRFAARAVRLARAHYDLIICNHVAVAQVGLLIHEFCGKPFWVVCHGWEVWGHLPILKRLALKRAEMLLPISRYTASKLVSEKGTNPERLQVLYNAIPDDFVQMLVADGHRTRDNLSSVHFAKQRAENEKILLSVGNLGHGVEYKGFDLVIKALPQILRQFPNIRYTIVGTGSGRAMLQTLAAQHNVAGRVEFVENLSDAELAARYKSCDLFVLPSGAADSNGGWHAEGFGRVYAEASLAGKPVIASRVGGAPEALLDGETGFLVNPGSVEEVAGAVNELLANPDRAESLGRAGRKFALEHFTSDAMRKSLRIMLKSRRTVSSESLRVPSRASLS